MSDTNTESAFTADDSQGVVTPEPGAAADVPVPAVTSQEGALVGDDNQPAVRDATVDVVRDQVPAQVATVREGDSDTVHVHEVSVTLDEVITDPSSPEAVQVPDAGRSPLLTSGLPIAALDAKRPEDVFAEAKSDDES